MTFNLKQFQRHFVEAITSGRLNDSKLLEHMIPSKNLNAKEALETYLNDYNARLSEALQEKFISVHFVIGDESFYEVCRLFLNQFSSRSYDLDAFGHEFPHFISQHSLSKEFPFLKDLATLDLTFNQFFHASLEEPVEPEIFEQLEDPGSLKVQFIRNFKLFNSPYPLYDIWQWRDNSEQELNLSQAQALLLFKSQAVVKSTLLSPIQFQLLKYLHQGLSLMETLEYLEMDEGTDISTEVAQLFGLLRTEGLILKILS